MKRHSIGTIFVLLTFGVLASAILLVLLLGADSYRQLSERGAKSYEKRICVQYIASKVRHNDVSGGVFVDGFSLDEEDIPTLYLVREVEGEPYYTRIYYYDGSVRELFASALEEFEPEDGNEVMEAGGLDFWERDGELTVEATDTNGQVTALTLALRSGEAEA
ncbi:DUF4860 domain-containing protein [Oscillibacter sp. MSJ-2]|uniref:DUF4860 domain-containing protein n=1 Tax=Dysosmobacter acutus TaxID=2841504 RepID=A0ABS6F8H7_9FIRM|nr:DUF4860 domain-containing protein [Dysosmobacter acutus]MBU5626597.1 DUF4860 domain-containing protein [Dysosmobacter acutus]